MATPSTPTTFPAPHAEGTSPERCAWCDRPLAESGKGLPGRILCTSCGAATTDPWPSERELEDAYATYRPAAGRFSGFGDALLRRTRGRLARRIDRLAPPGPVLDVGAGDGTLLDALAARGREALGLERDPRRPDVREADITELRGQWSAIIFWHALEHLPAPGQALDNACAQVAPGGALFVAIPNTASLQARVFGDRWFHLDLPRHLVHLPVAALLERLRSRGLTPLRVSHWRGGQILFGWLHGMVASLPGRPDLYEAIRRPDARSAPLTSRRWAFALAAGTALLPVAALATVVEVVARRGGTVYVEARR
jgi:SAM-dependent methyltransferase